MFGTRLKRMSDRFFSDLKQIYKSENIRFEANWFPVFYLLDVHPAVTIAEIAGQLEITHSGASQIVTTLKKKGFVKISQGRADKRVKTVTLTQSGNEKLNEIRPVWHAIQDSMHDRSAAGKKPFRALTLLGELEAEMSSIDLVDRVVKKLERNRIMDQIQIRPYSGDSHDPFMALVLAWLAENPQTMLENFGWINQTDRVVFQDQTAVIFIAAHQDEVIGACAADIDKQSRCAELTMIYEKARISNNVAQALMEQTLKSLTGRQITSVMGTVDTGNSTLLKLYQKNGFKLTQIEKMTGTTCARLSKPTTLEKKET